MKTLKEIADQLKIEIKQKKKDLVIVKTDQIINDLKLNDLAIWYTTHPETNYRYMSVSPKIPYRVDGRRAITKCLGNIDKLDEETILAKKREAIAHFKNVWFDMRNDFEILKNNS
jgi:hypothetical protein